MTFFSRNYKTFLALPVVLSVVAIAAIAVWGLRPGIDLSGGSLLEMSYASTTPPSVEQVQAAVAPLALGEVRVQPAGEHNVLLRLRALSNDEKNSLETALQTLGSAQEQEFTSVGPTIGAEMLHKGYLAIVLVVLCIIGFIAFAFRSVSEPVSSWKYGVVAIVTLAHDVLIPAGLFAVLGHLYGTEVGSLFIVAMLTILGISINNTIVIFDRVRENLRRERELRRKEKESFADTVGHSIRQTFARSINTSVAVIIVLAALLYLGPVSTQDFALALLVGMLVGTYSSIFLASPLLVLWAPREGK